MFAFLVTTVVLTLLYGLVWHDQPLRQPERVRSSDRKYVTMNELTQFLMSHGGPVLLAIVLVEQAGLPLPSAPCLLAAGALSATGKLNPVLALAMTALACVVAD